MARPYSLDLRARAVATVAAGESRRKVAETYRVSVASVVKWSQRVPARPGAPPPSAWSATSLARWLLNAIGSWLALPRRRT